MRHAEGEPAHALRAIAAPLGDVGGLLGRFDHWHHDAHHPGVEGRRDQVIVRARHAGHRDEAGAAGEGRLCFERFDAAAGMLGVEDAELGSGVGHDLAEPRRKELECHVAECRAALAQVGANRIAPHASPHLR